MNAFTEMNPTAFSSRLYLSTVAGDAPALARRWGLGLELAEYCTASNMDRDFPATDELVRRNMEGVERFVFHGPFNELCPAAIDPLVRALSMKRYRQAAALAGTYRIRKLVIHSGFVPRVYHPAWFVPESVSFWQEFLAPMPEDTVFCLENVMETAPELLTEIARRVDDPRLRLCLDLGHANLNDLPVERWVDAMAPWLSHVHIHNNDGREDRHDSLGEGTMDMDRLLTRLEQVGQSLTYTIENASAADSVRWLWEHGYIGGKP